MMISRNFPWENPELDVGALATSEMPKETIVDIKIVSSSKRGSIERVNRQAGRVPKLIPSVVADVLPLTKAINIGLGYQTQARAA